MWQTILAHVLPGFQGRLKVQVFLYRHAAAFAEDPPRRGRVGFLLCRNIDDFDLFIQRCKDTYNDDRGLIIPLVDNDIISLLNNIRNYSPNRYLEDFLSHRVAKLIL